MSYLRNINVKGKLIIDVAKNKRNNKESINQNWNTFENAVLTPVAQQLQSKKNMKQTWRTDNILKLTDIRKNIKNKIK